MQELLCRGRHLHLVSMGATNSAPSVHPLAEANLARDSILAMLQSSYTAPEPATRDTQALTDPVSVAIPVEAFILFTEMALREERMVTNTPPHRHHASGWLAFLSLTYGALAAVFALPSHLTRQRVVDPRRSHAPPSRLTRIRSPLQLATILSPISPLPRRVERAPSATRHVCLGLSFPSRIFLSLRSLRVTSQFRIPIGCNMLYITLHLPLGDRQPHGL